jgi:hypothetical protein
MSTCALALVTRGYLCCDLAQNQMVSCDRPEFVGIVEVRPKIRQAETPPPGPTPAMSLTATELRPGLEGRAEVLTPSPEGPKMVSAQDLRPKMGKAEED